MDSQDTKNRREFLKTGVLAAGAATVAGGGLLTGALPALGAQFSSGRLTRGDAAILRFLSAAEQIESDLWQQYTELGGVQDAEMEQIIGHKLVGGNPAYTNALSQLDSDMAQYIHDNTDDEFSHFRWINAFLAAKGAETVDLSQFKTLQGSTAEGSLQLPRLTNLLQLTVDTTFWTRYRSSTENPDLNPNFVFPQAVPGVAGGQRRAIPKTNADNGPTNHIQAIANVAALHFCFIESSGVSLYMQLAQRVSSVEVLRILLSIGPVEGMHFQTWHDKAGNGITPPIAPFTDPDDAQVTFPNINVTPGGEGFQANLIMPEPVPFLSSKFPAVSIVRPTETLNAAQNAVKALTADGLFIGQSKQFTELFTQLAVEADAARREQF
jgi:ferritin-like protein